MLAIASLLLTTDALATDLCIGTSCLEQPLRDALAAQGLRDIDGIGIGSDGAGGFVALVASNDGRTLDAIGAMSGHPALSVANTDAYVLALPLDLGAFDALAAADGGTDPLATSVQFPYQLMVASGSTALVTSVQGPYQIAPPTDGTAVTSVQWPYRVSATGVGETCVPTCGVDRLGIACSCW